MTLDFAEELSVGSLRAFVESTAKLAATTRVRIVTAREVTEIVAEIVEIVSVDVDGPQPCTDCLGLGVTYPEDRAVLCEPCDGIGRIGGAR